MKKQVTRIYDLVGRTELLLVMNLYSGRATPVLVTVQQLPPVRANCQLIYVFIVWAQLPRVLRNFSPTLATADTQK